jgi:hypothetical protein
MRMVLEGGVSKIGPNISIWKGGMDAREEFASMSEIMGIISVTIYSDSENSFDIKGVTIGTAVGLGVQESDTGYGNASLSLETGPGAGQSTIDSLQKVSQFFGDIFGDN